MLESVVKTIDRFNVKQGEVSCLLAIPLLLVVVYEVLMRYAFNAPTIWGFEATTFLYGLHYMLGLAYTDVLNGHVKVDIFTARMRTRTQAVLAIFTNLVFFMPVIACLTLWSAKFALTSFQGNELNSTSWAPPIWPLKIVMALAFFFLLLQGISNLLRQINTLTGKQD